MNSFATFHIVSLCILFLCMNEFVSEYIFGSHFNVLIGLNISIVESKHMPRVNVCQVCLQLCVDHCVKSKHLLKVGVHKVCLQFLTIGVHQVYLHQVYVCSVYLCGFICVDFA
jgi:hypothetical protein